MRVLQTFNVQTNLNNNSKVFVHSTASARSFGVSHFISRTALQSKSTPVLPTSHPANMQRCQAEPSSTASTSSVSPSPTAALTYTSYEGNAWRAELTASGVKFLVDPWLEGSLTFGGLDFIYQGTKRATRNIDIDSLAAATDFILLTMSIDDHAHRPTLKRLPKTIPVVGSPSAAAVARELGYQTVYSLDHGEEISLSDGKIKIQATQGALVGPPWSKRENGFVIKESGGTANGISLYYEPHADYVANSVAQVGTVDVVVSPPCTQSLLGYQLVKGATDNVPLLKMLKPKVVVPLMNAEFDASGPLNALLTETGGPEELQRQLQDVPELRNVKICVPKAGQPMAVEF